MTIIISVKHQLEDVYRGIKLVKAEEGTEETFYTGDLEADYKNALKFCIGQYLILDQSVENFVRGSQEYEWRIEEEKPLPPERIFKRKNI